ncbi:hypothetical protein HG530_015176 [Fusarium avenaceum]|nr:hypothetical protein HG530_015176 [Fusarium avenaceum]
MAQAYSNPSSSRTSDDIELPRHDGPFEPRALQDEEQIDPWEEGLGTFDVFALIVNKMIGTGIYTAPTTVYLMTGSKSLTLGLFGVGFLYCLMSTAIYLQYAAVLPYNGGELVYLDEITAHVTPTSNDALVVPVPQEHNEGINGTLERQATNSRNSTASGMTNTASYGLWARFVQWRRKLMGDGLLAFIIYSLMFIVFFNSATNSMQFGRMVLLCINADQGVDNAIVDVNNDLMRYIGVTILTVICLTQFFSPSFGRRLNKFLAVVKIGFLLGLVIVGLTALSRDIKDENEHDTTKSSDWSKWNEREDPSKVSFAKALLIVLFSFEGWENATFVSSFLLPLSPLLQILRGEVAGEIPQRKHKILRRGFIWAVVTVGSLYLLVVGVTLNSLQWVDFPDGPNINYAPFSNRTERIRENDFHYKSPQGGLIAHWLSSVILIAASASIKSTTESAGLPGYIQTYTHCFILMVMAIGYLNLRSRQEALQRQGDTNGTQTSWGRLYEAIMIVTIPFYILLNIAILVINAIPEYVSSDGTPHVFPGYGFPVIVASVVVIGTAYYVLFFGAAYRSYEPLPATESDEEIPQSRMYEGILKPESRFNLMKHAGVRCDIHKDYFYKRVERMYRFGRRWRMQYSIRGVDPEYPGEPQTDQTGTTFAMILYWVFGGTRLKEDRTPWARLKERTERLKEWTKRLKK